MEERKHPGWEQGSSSNIPETPHRDVGARGTSDVPGPPNRDDIKPEPAEDLSDDEVTPEPPD